MVAHYVLDSQNEKSRESVVRGPVERSLSAYVPLRILRFKSRAPRRFLVLKSLDTIPDGQPKQLQVH